MADLKTNNKKFGKCALVVGKCDCSEAQPIV